MGDPSHNPHQDRHVVHEPLATVSAIGFDAAMGAQRLLQALGIQILHVQDLPEGAIYIKDRRLLMLDNELSDEQVEDVANQTVAAL